MKLGEIYQLAIESGIENDPRGREAVAKELQKQQNIYDHLQGAEKDCFDTELLKNPFGDTRLLVGEEDAEISGLICGVDMETQEILLADRLREKGANLQLVLSHHPEGPALAGLSNVMGMQSQIFHLCENVPVHIAEDLMRVRIGEIRRRLSPTNFQRAVDAAQLLGLNMMCVHTPCDNHVHQFLTARFAEAKPQTVGDVVDVLYSIEEYRLAAAKMNPPMIIAGSKGNACGNIHLEMTGGTGTSTEIYKELSARGIGTVVCMHMRDECREQAEKYHMNVVIAGHMASDSVGINLFLDKLARRGVEIIPASGLLRVTR